MSFKFNTLYNKIYSAFVRGEYGQPRIPNKSEVVRKMEEITSSENVPITKSSTLANVNIDEIRAKFSDTIDDIDVLFNSIEYESRNILDQLTNSLKEHRGAKRELRRINARVEDINNGKLGEEYLKYNFTETFNDLSNINTLKSDPVFLDAGVFSIPRDSEQLLSMNHYYDSKLEFNIIENYARIDEQIYIGTTNAAAMLDERDPRQLVYRIQTNKPTMLKTSVTFQLAPDGRQIEINGVTLDLDSSISKGKVRLYYRDQYKWKDIKTSSIKNIVEDKVTFNFPNVKATHIKFEFIKETPDVPASNYYYYIFNNLSIFRGTTKRKAVLYSKPVTVNSYNKETPLISDIKVFGDIDIPETCDAKLYIAQDIPINGQFLDNNGNPVYADSSNVVEFDSSLSGSIYLSDIWNSESAVSGLELYRGLDFDWLQIKSFDNEGQTVPSKVSFNNTRKKSKIDNSLFTITSRYLFGDTDYTGVYDLSGWVNTSNDQWAQMEPLVNSGILVSGESIAADWVEDASGNLNPDVYSDPAFSGQWIGYARNAGYPFSYYLSSQNANLKFNEYESSINGWWRPLSEFVKPSGLDNDISSSGNINDGQLEFLPDFHFNGLDFYKIYKFGVDENVLDPTIKLYTYQERPLISESGYYPANFVWRYRSRWIDEISTKENVKMVDPPSSFDNYIIPVSPSTLRPNEEYIVDAIEEVRVHGTSVVLDNSEYFTQPIGKSSITGINLSGFSEGTNFPTKDISFDFKYRYRVKNEYLSSWVGYAIVSQGTIDPTITIANKNVSDRRNIPLIKNVVVTNLDTGETNEVSSEGNLFNIYLNRSSSSSESHFRISIFCASDENTGFCADQWVPHEGTRSKTIEVSPGIRLVPKLKPITIVDLNTLIYDTPMSSDDKAAIYKEETGEKYIVVKSPSKDLFPGYYFDNINKRYIEDDSTKIENIGHWVRNGVDITFRSIPGYSGLVPVYSDPFTYTTGSNASGVVYKYDRINVDNSWNNGSTLPDYPNYTGIPFYSHHSTYGYPININNTRKAKLILEAGMIDPRAPYVSSEVGSSPWITWISGVYPSDYQQWVSDKQVNTDTTNRGFLFYETAENLPAFYSISYRTITGDVELNKRFLYKLELTSESQDNLVPVVRSLKFIINDSED